MTDKSLVSIIVPSRTGQIIDLYSRLLEQSLKEWELIVKSGISPAGRARNLGARDAKGEILIFIDDDARFDSPQLLEELVCALSLVGNEDAVGVIWELPADASRFQKWQVRQSFRPKIAGDAGQLSREVNWHEVGTACFAIRRKTFERLGGFSDRLISGEDYEFCYRIHLGGGRVHALTNRRIYHYPPANIGQLLSKTVWYERGNAQVAKMHPSSGYRMQIPSFWHAAGYLLARTILLVPLMFFKVSYHERRPKPDFRPLAALLSYIGAWIYCTAWFTTENPALVHASAQTQSRSPEAGVPSWK